MPKKLYTLRLDEEKVIKPLKKMAEKQNRPTSNLIETILLDYLNKQKK